MRQLVAGGAARLYGPLLLLAAFALLATAAPGRSMGLAAGLTGALAVVLHALVFGAAAVRRAWPPVVARAVFVIGALAGLAGVSRTSPDAPVIADAGACLMSLAGASLLVQVLFARAPALEADDL